MMDVSSLLSLFGAKALSESALLSLLCSECGSGSEAVDSFRIAPSQEVEAREPKG